MSPGAALAFLLTGPATNVTTFGVLAQLHGRRGALLFGVTTLVLTVSLGYLTNFVLSSFSPNMVTHEHAHATPVQKVSLALLIALYLLSLMRRGARSFLGELFSQGPREHEHDGSRRPLPSS